MLRSDVHSTSETEKNSAEYISVAPPPGIPPWAERPRQRPPFGKCQKGQHLRDMRIRGLRTPEAAEEVPGFVRLNRVPSL